MLDALLENPIVIGVVILVLLILIAIPMLVRRRRAAREDVLPPPELGQSVDYTSLPYEEPQTLGERLRQAPVGVKLLLGLVPLALIIAAVVLYLTFFSGPAQVAAEPTPPPPPPAITDVTATLAGPTRIVVEASTNLPNGTSVSASMKQGDQDLAWFNQASATGQVSSGRIRLVLEKVPNGPAPTSDQPQTVTVVSTVNDQVVSSEAATLEVPSIYRSQFYGAAAAAPATAEPVAQPTAAAAEPLAVINPDGKRVQRREHPPQAVSRAVCQLPATASRRAGNAARANRRQPLVPCPGARWRRLGERDTADDRPSRGKPGAGR
jgi:hypothetical protein